MSATQRTPSRSDEGAPGPGNGTGATGPGRRRGGAGTRSGVALEYSVLPVMKAMSSSQQVLEFDGALGFLVTILHDHRSIKRETPFGGFAFAYGTRTRDNNGVFGDHERTLGGGTIDLFAHDVVHRCGAREDRSSTEHSAAAD